MKKILLLLTAFLFSTMPAVHVYASESPSGSPSSDKEISLFQKVIDVFSKLSIDNGVHYLKEAFSQLGANYINEFQVAFVNALNENKDTLQKKFLEEIEKKKPEIRLVFMQDFLPNFIYGLLLGGAEESILHGKYAKSLKELEKEDLLKKIDFIKNYTKKMSAVLQPEVWQRTAFLGKVVVCLSIIAAFLYTPSLVHKLYTSAKKIVSFISSYFSKSSGKSKEREAVKSSTAVT